jgi:hypothetical protein
MARAKAALCDLFEAAFVYRSLVPVDPRLRPIEVHRAELGLPATPLPRKADPAYARVLALILADARRIRGAATRAECLLYIGDTMRNDATAFRNLRHAMGCEGLAFIGDESESASNRRRETSERGTITRSNRWSDVAVFASEVEDRGFGRDERSVVVVDIDKTLLGARGRNDGVIDRARREAAFRAAAEVAEELDRASFDREYGRINRPEFHTLTEDNQDAVVYLSLLLSGGWVKRSELGERPPVSGFSGLVEWVETRKSALPGPVRRLHGAIRDAVLAGNATPFVAFRRAEYRETVARMGAAPDESSDAEILQDEIVITQEVWEVVSAWKARGVQLLALSDKPDEACLPTTSDAAAGLRPIHQTRTHVIGGLK